LSGKPAPTIKIPYPIAYAAGAITTAFAQVTGKPPLAPLEGVKMASKKMFVTHDKAARELGFASRPVEDALRRAIDWFRANGYV